MSMTTSSRPWIGWLLSDEPQSRAQATLGRYYGLWLSFRRNPLAIAGLAIVVGLLVVAVFAPLMASPDKVITQSLSSRLMPPSWEHWFGTDQLGRDIFARIVHGTRITLAIIFLVSVIALPIGLTVGMLAGYKGGWIDVVLMRLTDVFLSFPRLILALAMVAALGPSILNAVVAIALTSWPPYARMARAETKTMRNNDFILAAQMQGASAARILVRYVMPLCMPSVLVRLTLDMAGVILIAAGLGFLGLGVQPPTPEWGAMVSDGRDYLLNQWWVSTIPGLAICIVSLGFNLLGDALRDSLGPKSDG